MFLELPGVQVGILLICGNKQIIDEIFYVVFFFRREISPTILPPARMLCNWRNLSMKI